MGMISAITKRPGQPPRHVNVSNKLETLQKNVGGYIECVRLATNLVILCDEEGRLKNKPFNCTICGYGFWGDILIVGADEDEFADLPVKYEVIKALLPKLWEGPDYDGRSE